MRLGSFVLAGVVVLSVSAPPEPLLAQQTLPMPSSTASDYKFPSGAGLLFFYVRPDKTADFEAVMARLGDALDKTEDPVRKQQAASWHILRSVESTPDAAIYVCVMVPAVSTADYDPIKILGEAAPSEVQGLYERLRDAVIRVERMGLAKLR